MRRSRTSQTYTGCTGRSCPPSPQVDGLRDARAELGVLYRLELGERSGDVVLLVQSGVSPDWSHLARGYLAVSAGTMENPATKDVSKSLDALHDGPAPEVPPKGQPDQEDRNQVNA